MREPTLHNPFRAVLPVCVTLLALTAALTGAIAASAQELPWISEFNGELDPGWRWIRDSPSEHWFGEDGFLYIARGDSTNRLMRPIPGGQFAMFVSSTDYPSTGRSAPLERILYLDADNNCTLKDIGFGIAALQIKSGGNTKTWIPEREPGDSIYKWSLGLDGGDIRATVVYEPSFTMHDSVFTGEFTPAEVGFQPSWDYTVGTDTMRILNARFWCSPYTTPARQTQFELMGDGTIQASWEPSSPVTPCTEWNVSLSGYRRVWLPAEARTHTFQVPLPCLKELTLKVYAEERLPRANGGYYTIPVFGSSQSLPSIATLRRTMFAEGGLSDGTRFGADFAVRPSRARCSALQESSSTTEITYAIECNGSYRQNVFLVVEMYPLYGSGGHSHGDIDRPIGSVEPAPGIQWGPSYGWYGPGQIIMSGSTGPDGLGFVVNHTWPENCGVIGFRVLTPEPGSEFEYNYETAFTLAVAEDLYTELPDSPLYRKTSATTAIHPGYFGHTETLDALRATAEAWNDIRGSAKVVGYNDISLEWGGVFDGDLTWTGPRHCGHRTGLSCDFQTHGDSGFTPEDLKKLEGIVQTRFSILPEDNHWHITLAPHTATPLGSELAAEPLSIRTHPSPTNPEVFLEDSGAIDAEARLTDFAELSAVVTYDADLNLYSYEYRIDNDLGSLVTIESAVLASMNLTGASIASPTGWASVSDAPYPGMLSWSIPEPGPPPMNWTEPSILTYPSQFGVSPGTGLSGFTVLSPAPPDSVEYRIQGWWLRTIAAEGEAYAEPTPFFRRGAFGKTLGPAAVSTGAPVEPGTSPSSATRLGAAAPNPFNPSTTISYSLESAVDAELIVYDLAGRRVKTLVSGNVEAGQHEAQWDGRDEQGRRVASGVYLYRLVAGEFSETKRMVLLK